MWDCSFIASNRIVLLASRRQSRLPISEFKLDHNYKIKTIYLYMFFFFKSNLFRLLVPPFFQPFVTFTSHFLMLTHLAPG